MIYGESEYCHELFHEPLKVSKVTIQLVMYYSLIPRTIQSLFHVSKIVSGNLNHIAP